MGLLNVVSGVSVVGVHVVSQWWQTSPCLSCQYSSVAAALALTEHWTRACQTARGPCTASHTVDNWYYNIIHIHILRQIQIQKCIIINYRAPTFNLVMVNPVWKLHKLKRVRPRDKASVTWHEFIMTKYQASQ